MLLGFRGVSGGVFEVVRFFPQGSVINTEHG